MSRILVVRSGESPCHDELWSVLQRIPGFDLELRWSNGAAVEEADRSLPDLTVLDCTGPCSFKEKPLGFTQSGEPVVVVVERQDWRRAQDVIAWAHDFVLLPVHPEEMIARLCRLLERRSATAPRRAVSEASQEILDGIVGRDPAFVEVKASLPTLAAARAPVLISGETGTGKEVVARAIHDLSLHAGGPFVPVNCGAIPRDLFESELFGHCRGSFTGASSDHAGYFAQAAGGSIFLDEIDAIPLHDQIKLLRALQSCTYQRVGGERMEHVDVRIIAATNADLRDRMRRNRFRSDLYYRLNILSLRLPPLRHRRSDIPVLANFFLDKYTREYGTPVRALTSEALRALMDAPWPGNVRELESTIHRAVVMTPSSPIGLDGIQIENAELHGALDASARASYREAKAAAMVQFERSFVLRVLERHSGNLTKAAQAAGTDRRVFTRMIRRHHLETELYAARGQAV